MTYEEKLEKQIRDAVELTSEVLIKIPGFIQVMNERSEERVEEKWIYHNYMGSKLCVIDVTHHSGKMTVDSFLGNDGCVHIWFDDGNMRLELTFDSIIGFNLFDKYMLLGLARTKEALILFINTLKEYIERRE